MSDILKELKQKQEKIVNFQRTKARQEGQRDQILQQLKEKFGVDSLDDGKKKLKKMDNEIRENEVHIEELDEEMERIISAAEVKETED